jgi:hypothetical protein
MIPSSDTQRFLSDAHLTVVQWTPESGWTDTEDRLRLAVGITAEEKLARLTEAIKGLPDLATRLVQMSERIAEMSDCLAGIAGRKNRS